jgi:HAMP domain-containing protein
MKLMLKFNLIFLLLVGSGLFLLSRVAHKFLNDNAKAQVVQQAELMMESAKATRDYTSEELKPLLASLPEHKKSFVPQTVPAYGATTSFERLRKKFPDYTYKEASLNPTNLRNRAQEWEADIINHFRDHPDDKSLVGERQTPNGASLFLAHPLSVKATCIECHSVPAAAPKAMIKRYGSVNGFGWKLNEVVAAQVVSVPMAVPIQIADQAYRTLMLYLIVTFLATMLAIDAALYFIVIRPVRNLSAMADRVSRGEMDMPQLTVRGNDEISQVTTSFNRMYVSVVKALKLLNR